MAEWPAPVYVRVREGDVHSSQSFTCGTTMDYDSAGKLLGVEVIDAIGVTVHGKSVAALVPENQESDMFVGLVPGMNTAHGRVVADENGRLGFEICGGCSEGCSDCEA